MKKIILSSVAIASLGLTACQTATISQKPTQNPPIAPVTTPNNPLQGVMSMSIPTLDDLQDYHWQLVKASDTTGKSLSAFNSVIASGDGKLDFQQNRMNYSVGCNHLSASVVLNAGVLQVKDTATTLMACGDVGQAETLLANNMQGNSQLNLQSGQNIVPILTQITAQNNVLVWQGTLKPEKRYGSQGETIFLQVAPADEPCDNVSGKRCLMVRDISYNEQGIKTKTGDWHVMHEPIEGYQKSPNQGNILRLKRYRTAPSDTMGYGNAYVLDMVVESTQLTQ